MDVGLIGLGAMGQGIARTLLKAGHTLRVWNRSPGPVDALVAQGAQRCADALQAAQGPALVSMLANDVAYREVFVAGGVLDAMQKGSVHINMASISVALLRRLATMAKPPSRTCE